MICPRCSVSEISPVTGACRLCGYRPDGDDVLVETPNADPTAELAGRELAHQFRIDVLLAQGPASGLYLARETGSDLHFALRARRRPAGRDADERFQRAITAAASLDHPHIIAVHRWGLTDSLFWYATRYVIGRSLRELLQERGAMDLRSCLRLVQQLAAALDYAHRRGVAHGDLTPENVLIDTNDWAYLTDFAVARALETAPSDANPQDDQYALAAIVHECLLGVAPPAGGGTARDRWPPEVPEHFALALRRALSERPADRFPSVAHFAAELEAPGPSVMDARPSGSTANRVLTDPEWSPPTRPRRRILYAALFVAAAAAPWLLWTIVWGRQAAPPELDVTVDFPESTFVFSPAVDTAPAPSAPAAPAARAPRRATTETPPIARPARPAQASTRRTGDTAGAASRSTARTPAPARAEPREAAPPGETGRLFVSAQPWGALYIDGQLVGNTPRANLPLSPGFHRIRVVRDGYEPYERTVMIEPGGVLRVTDIVLVERRP